MVTTFPTGFYVFMTMLNISRFNVSKGHIAVILVCDQANEGGIVGVVRLVCDQANEGDILGVVRLSGPWSAHIIFYMINRYIIFFKHALLCTGVSLQLQLLFIYLYVLCSPQHLPPGLSFDVFFPLLAAVVHIVEPLCSPHTRTEVNLSAARETVTAEHASLSVPNESLITYLREVVLIYDKANR